MITLIMIIVTAMIVTLGIAMITGASNDPIEAAMWSWFFTWLVIGMFAVTYILGNNEGVCG